MRSLMTVAILTGALALAACNTVSGMGRDVSSAGTAVSNAADGSH